MSKKIICFFSRTIMIIILCSIVLMFVCCPMTNDRNYQLQWNFDANGGEGTVASVTANFTYTSGTNGNEYYWVNGRKTIALPYGNNLSRSGYVFCGWSKNPYGTEECYQEGSSRVPLYREVQYSNSSSSGYKLVEENLKVTWYAIWRQKKTITLDSNGGDGSSKQIKYMLGYPVQRDSDCVYLNTYYNLRETDDNIDDEDYLYDDLYNTIEINTESFTKNGNEARSFNSRSDGTGNVTVENVFGRSITLKYSEYESLTFPLLGDDFTLYAIY